ncbi:NADPH-dependent ferric siderophore reductase [Glaciihabitans tibetensis]|uniref:NADPH-dependent ferric siderophore reductase n=1 Tax=Glaciihabitans tibetensis TaxID=1266600 RepID=A0A2T0VB33_9MICO|nr:siderophore-interacting protein [Glaciihabitans tibetensis]PRY67409.1 NADPH-dependent ferric siderophore reductase [Glaciihabitans tibetensis]
MSGALSNPPAGDVADPTVRSPRRTPSAQHVFVVDRSESLSPHLVRVHLGGSGFETFVQGAHPDRLAATDKYVKLYFARADLRLVPPYDLDELRAALPPDDLPVLRTYTVRSVDHSARTIAIDFVVHGDEGVAGPWAASTQPGDLIAMSSPGGMYSPDPDPAVEHLLLGDDSAIPAIAAALEAMPTEARGLAIIEVTSSADEIPLTHPADVTLRWVHRVPSGRHVAVRPADVAAPHAEIPGTVLVAAVRDLPAPTSPVQVFAHGERGAMNALRAVLQDEWGIARKAMSLSAYWALGRAEDRFQAEKREPVGQIFAD